MKKRIIHTSDWHLGKRLYQEDRTSEHSAYLNWLLDYANEHEVDVLLMSGDLFDSPNPPHSAQRAYYDFLAKWFSHSESREAFVMGGNHDSGPLINAPYSLLESALKGGRLKLIGNFEAENWQNFVFKRQWGSVCALPYFRLHEILNLARVLNPKSENSPESTEVEAVRLLQTLETLFNKWRESLSDNGATILMGHHVFGPYMASGSELGVPLSGLETIPLGVLGKWDYVALGHIHKPQVMNFENMPVVYSGSPLRMRFSEHEKKKISVIEIDSETKKLSYELIDIPAFRKLYRLKAKQENLKEKIAEIVSEELTKENELQSFIEAELGCENPWIGAADEIREELIRMLPDVPAENRPKLLSAHHKINSNSANDDDNNQRSSVLNLASLNIEELFEKYYEQKFPDSTALPSEIRNLFQELLRDNSDSDEELFDEY